MMIMNNPIEVLRTNMQVAGPVLPFTALVKKINAERRWWSGLGVRLTLVPFSQVLSWLVYVSILFYITCFISAMFFLLYL